ncbi:hypothetical protein BH20VER1_BH20VER1_19820 [soil metagenome]
MKESPSPSTDEDLGSELQRQYSMRFAQQASYRDAVWKILTAEFFQKYVPPNATLLDLGCGWGEFINNIRAGKKYAMDLNPEARERLNPEVELLLQDCSSEWPLPENSLDCIFTSNFFEHLPGKNELRRTLVQAHRCLRPNGRLICMGPNVRYLSGAYWDFWDHHVALTDLSLKEVLELTGFRIERSEARFLPYQMSRRRPAPLWTLQAYLKMPIAWPFFGKQFLVIASK